MGSSQEIVDYVLDQLSSLPGVRARKMFGEWAVYFEEKVVLLICDDQVFVKITEPGRALVGDSYEEGQAYPGAKPSMLLGADFVDDSERFSELVRITAKALPKPRLQSTLLP